MPRGGLRRFVVALGSAAVAGLKEPHPPLGWRLARGSFLKRRGIGVGFSIELEYEGRTIVTPGSPRASPRSRSPAAVRCHEGIGVGRG